MSVAQVFLTVTGGSSPSVDFSLLANYGVLGLFAGILTWFAFSTVARERKRGDEAVAEVARLNGVIADRMMPAIVEFTRTSNEALLLLRARGHG